MPPLPAQGRAGEQRLHRLLLAAVPADQGAGLREGEAMTRAERLHAIACSIVRTLHHDRWHPARVETEARENATLRGLAEAALDAADSTREPCSVPAVPPRQSCPLCKRPPITVLSGHFRWETTCGCVSGRCRIGAVNSVRRWLLNCRAWARICAAKAAR